MKFTLQQSFEDHSKQYGSRVKDRKKYANLSLEDTLITSFIEQSWQRGKQGVLLDAACGSGDRLRMLFENSSLPRSYFRQIIGYDYAQGMLDIAAVQTLEGKPLYDELQNVDLLTALPNGQADLILCLWEVTNSVGKNADHMIANLAGVLLDGGYLIYDMITTKAVPHLKQEEERLLETHSELQKDPDAQRTWYQRDDKSIGYLRMFNPAELNGLLECSELKTCKVWGYRHRELIPHELTIKEGRIDEEEAANYSGIVVVQQKTLG
jgi:SAM-dependent methyltransferase